MLLVVFLVVWIWAAIDPLYRDGWLLENVLVVMLVPLIVFGGMYFKLSNLSYTLITLFTIMHVVGSHYTYAEVPFGFMLQDWLDASRNMYDRLVHFSFGLLLAYPVREVFMRLARTRGAWGFFFPVELIFAASALFEIIEWIVVEIADPAAGLAFLGVQGDIWDAQKDMLLAGIGAFIAMAVVFCIHWRNDKRFWYELWESVRPNKGDRPIGEEAFDEIAKDRLES